MLNIGFFWEQMFCGKEAKLTNKHFIRTALLLTVVSLTALPCVLGVSENGDDVKTQCENCRILVEKFKAEFKATDRGLYEGGDTDWELKNMKDYKKSEIRFIEITENIYKSKIDKVTRVLEKVEETLEEFWFHHWDHIGADGSNELEAFLCVSHLKTCCNFGFFGPDCSICLVGEKGNCSGFGTCNGNGTRSGTGACDCSDGYKGEFCEECKEGFTRKQFDSNGADESGDAVSNECEDIDECKYNPNPCGVGKFCSNTPGNYTCEECHYACNKQTCDGPSASDCTGNSCAEGYSLDTEKDGKGCRVIEPEKEKGELDDDVMNDESESGADNRGERSMENNNESNDEKLINIDENQSDLAASLSYESSLNLSENETGEESGFASSNKVNRVLNDVDAEKIEL